MYYRVTSATWRKEVYEVIYDLSRIPSTLIPIKLAILTNQSCLKLSSLPLAVGPTSRNNVKVISSASVEHLV